MPKSIRTKDGIVINNIPDDIAIDGPEVRQRVAEERAKRQQQADLPALQDLLVRQSKGEEGLQPAITQMREQLGVPDESRPTTARPITTGASTPEIAANIVGQALGYGDIGSGIAGAGRGLYQGALNVGGGILGLGAKALGADEFLQQVQATRAMERMKTEDAASRAPISTAAGEIVGSALPTAAAAPISIPAAMTVGAAEGAVLAEGTDQDLATNTLLGAAFPVAGALGGLALNRLSKIPNIIKGRNKQLDAIKKLLTDEAADSRIIGYELTADAATGAERIAKNPRLMSLAKEAENQGFTLGTLANVQSANPATKTEMRKMIEIIKKGATNENFRRAHSPSQIVGEALGKRYDAVIRANRKAGKDIKRLVDSELRGVNVEAGEVRDKFLQQVQDRLQVKFDDGVPNFEDSLLNISGENKTLINDMIRRTKNLDNIDAGELHDLKRIIDSHVNYSKTAGGQIGDVAPVLKSLRSDINARLRAENKRYGLVNDRFVETKEALAPIESIAGKTFDMLDNGQAAALGRLARREFGNAQSKELMIQGRKELDRVATKYGAKFNDDIEKLNNLSASLEHAFAGQAPTSLRGQVGADIEAAATRNLVGKLQLAKERIKQIGRTEQAKIKALEDFINE